MASQLVGAVAACLLLALLGSHARMGATIPSGSPWESLGLEVLLSFLLMGGGPLRLRRRPWGCWPSPAGPAGDPSAPRMAPARACDAGGPRTRLGCDFLKFCQQLPCQLARVVVICLDATLRGAELCHKNVLREGSRRDFHRQAGA